MRGEAKEGSDVDILVEFEKPIGFFKFLEIGVASGQVDRRKVNLISKKSLRLHVRKHVLEEIVTV